MHKIINPGILHIGSVKGAPLFCKIELSQDGRLSISGVEAPYWDTEDHVDWEHDNADASEIGGNDAL